MLESTPERKLVWSGGEYGAENASHPREHIGRYVGDGVANIWRCCDRAGYRQSEDGAHGDCADPAWRRKEGMGRGFTTACHVHVVRHREPIIEPCKAKAAEGSGMRHALRVPPEVEMVQSERWRE